MQWSLMERTPDDKWPVCKLIYWNDILHCNLLFLKETSLPNIGSYLIPQELFDHNILDNHNIQANNNAILPGSQYQLRK